MTKRPEVLFVGFDGAEPELIDQLCDAGKLPTLATLKRDHLSGRMSSIVGFGNDVLWSSFNTCVTPAKHGQYFYRQFDPATYECPIYQPPATRPETFWNVISRAREKIALVDIPFAPLCDDIKGMQIVEWRAHDSFMARWRDEAHGPDGQIAGALPYTEPPELAAELTSRFGIDMIGQRDMRGRGAADWKKLRDDLLVGIKRKADMCCAYLREANWDLFAVVFQEAHDAGHSLWHLHDASNPGHDPAWAGTHGDPIEDVYVAIDRAIGRIMDCAGPNAMNVVFAGAGMTNNYGANFLMDEVLHALELGRPPARRRVDVLKAIWRAMPASIRNRFRGIAMESEQALLVNDRRRRKFFMLPHTEASLPIRINLIGREADGLVAPGDEFDSVCETLMNDLRALTNGETGDPIVDEVFRTAERYDGPFVDLLPDIFVVWRKDAPVHRVVSPKFGQIERKDPGVRSGDHSKRCAFFASGPGVRPGHLNDAVKIWDFGPTIAARLGVELPDWVDGEPIAALGADRPVLKCAEQT